MRPASGGARPPEVTRDSWRLLDGEGEPVVWLAHSDQPLYEPSQAREFADAVGLEFRDAGVVPVHELVANRPTSPVNGPGTGRLSATLAPGRHWGMAAGVAAGTSLTAPLVSEFWAGGEIQGVGAVLGVVAFLLLTIAGPACAARLAAGLAALRWRAHWRGRTGEPRLLTSARRLPGLVLTARSDRLEIRDLRRTYSVPRGDGLALQPYEITPDRDRSESGLVVRRSDQVVAHIRVRFDPAEVHAFAGELGARSLPSLSRADRVPKPRSPRRGRRADERGPLESFVIGRPALYGWGVAAWTLTLASPILVATAAAALVGLVPLPVGYAIGGLAPGFLTVGGWTLFATQTPVWLRHPDRLDPAALDHRANPSNGTAVGTGIESGPTV